MRLCFGKPESLFDLSVTSSPSAVTTAPLLTLLAADMFGADPRCSGASPGRGNLYHFSLLHDDLMDQADMRRDADGTP